MEAMVDAEPPGSSVTSCCATFWSHQIERLLAAVPEPRWRLELVPMKDEGDQALWAAVDVHPG